MSKPAKYTVIFIGLSLLFGGVYFAYEIWKSDERGEYLSCLTSIAMKIEKSDKGKSLAEQNKDWKILNEEEVDSLMAQFQGSDCGKYPNQTLDIWNRRINISLRKPNDRIEVFVWSNGEDNISGTEDDLIIPWGQTMFNF